MQLQKIVKLYKDFYRLYWGILQKDFHLVHEQTFLLVNYIVYVDNDGINCRVIIVFLFLLNLLL